MNQPASLMWTAPHGPGKEGDSYNSHQLAITKQLLNTVSHITRDHYKEVCSDYCGHKYISPHCRDAGRCWTEMLDICSQLLKLT